MLKICHWYVEEILRFVCARDWYCSSSKRAKFVDGARERYGRVVLVCRSSRGMDIVQRLGVSVADRWTQS